MADSRFFKKTGAVTKQFLPEYDTRNAVVALTLIVKILETKKPPNEKTIKSLKNIIGNCGCLRDVIGDFATKVRITLNEKDKEKILEFKQKAILLKKIISQDKEIDQKILEGIILNKNYLSVESKKITK